MLAASNGGFCSECHTPCSSDRDGSGTAAGLLCITWCRGRDSNPQNILKSSHRESPTYKKASRPALRCRGGRDALHIGENGDQRRFIRRPTRPMTAPAIGIPINTPSSGLSAMVVSIVPAISVTVVTKEAAVAVPTASPAIATTGIIATDLLSNHSPRAYYLKNPPRKPRRKPLTAPGFCFQWRTFSSQCLSVAAANSCTCS